jgi:D-arabinose 1-dehydrogenase-like Zn-dependent alcohol dehydrogenase
VLGLGGLGHLGVQFASRMGFRTVAIARGKDKEPLARKLGAHHYVDSLAQDPAAELARLGGAKAILATVTNGKAMSAVQGGLAVDGVLIVLGVDDSQDTLSFSLMSGVRPMTETFPLEKAADAYERMMSGKVRFRAVLTTGS